MNSSPVERRGFGPTGRTLALWIAGLGAGAALTVTSILALRPSDESATELHTRALPALSALSETGLAAATGQDAFIDAVESGDPAVQAESITAAEAAGRTQQAAWSAYEELALDNARERSLRQAYEKAADESRALAASLLSLPRDDPTRAGILTQERQTAAEQSAILGTLTSEIYRPLVEKEATSIDDAIGATRTGMLALGAGLALAFTALALALLRGARRDQRAFASEANQLRLAGEQAELEGSLQRGLEMAPIEDATYPIIGQALSIVAPEVATELLLADTARSHFRQVLAFNQPQAGGCRAGTPCDCPVATSGQSRTFEDSRHLDACRYLREQDQPVWATCVPVSIGGRATGVVHAQLPIGETVPDRLPASLELVARKAGERIGALRMLARSEAEAQVDPLTGLPNRRSLEADVEELRVDDSPYVVAFADLDHFKEINDTYGHDAGDRALRLFARVLRDNVRPRDLISRHGGEEFLVVLPTCTIADARVVAERIRSELAQALPPSGLPPFTVTIGLAASHAGEPLSGTIAEADATMLRGKSAGRDRILAADEILAA